MHRRICSEKNRNLFIMCSFFPKSFLKMSALGCFNDEGQVRISCLLRKEVGVVYHVWFIPSKFACIHDKVLVETKLHLEKRLILKGFQFQKSIHRLCY